LIEFDTTVFASHQTISLSFTSVTTDAYQIILDVPSSGLTIAGSIINDLVLSIVGGSKTEPLTIGNITGSGSLTIGDGSTPSFLEIAPTAANATNSYFPSVTNCQSGLTITSTSGLDLTNNTLFINFGTAGLDPVQTITYYLALGYNNGSTNAWSGSLGIVSSNVWTLNTSGTLVFAVGYGDGNDGTGYVPGLSSGWLEIMPTLAGDATLQGKVIFADVQILDANYGQIGDWDQANFAYASMVNFGDYELISDNIGKDDSALF